MKDKDRQNASNRKTLQFLKSFWLKKRLTFLISGVLCLVAFVFAAQWMSAQDAANAPKSGKTAKLDSKAAWTELQQSAQNRLHAAEDQTAVVREIMNELANFARTYARTEAAIFAKLNHGTLAAALGDFETAEKSLQQALMQTRDPQMAEAIQAQLAQLSIRSGGSPPPFNANLLDGRKLSLPQGKDVATQYGVNSSRPVYASLGQPAPALAIQEWVRGTPTTLDDLKGKVVLLDIFQIICPGCHAAHPEIVRMQKRYADLGFDVLGLAVAFEYESVQTPKHIRDYVARKEYPYPVAIDKGLTNTFRRYRSRGTPYTVLIDRQGRIRYLDFFRLNRVEALVQQLLNEEAGG